MRESMSVAKLACCAGLAAAVSLGASARGQVVISQVYGGGGNAGAVYNNDFIELFNKGATTVNLAGYSVQYGSATGAFTGITTLSGSIGPGKYFLIQEAAGTGTPGPLPTPDATGNIAMSGTTGKVALANVATTVTCGSAAILDIVAWGPTATCAEGGAPAGTTANATAVIRNSNGCTDTNNNASDFVVGTPTARNSASPAFTCPTSTNPSGVGGSSPASVCPGTDVLMTVTVTPGANPTSTGLAVTGDTTSIGGPGTEQFFNDGTHGDAVANDNIWSLRETVFVSGIGGHTVPISITDNQGRTGAATVTVTVANCNPTGFATATPGGLCPGESTLITVRVTPGQSPVSTGITATADLSAAGGSSSQQLFDNGTNGDAVANDNIFSFGFTPGTLPEGAHALTAVAMDAQGRSTSTLNFNLNTVSTCTNAASTVVISQVYGGGGNTDATLTNDFIELFNRGTTPVNLAGLSVQYASGQNDANGFGVPDSTGPRLTPLSGTIQPGRYYLVQEAAGAGGTQGLPTPDATGTIALSATRGAIALVNGTSALGLNCTSTQILDLVGYGTSTNPANQAFCNEGTLAAGTLSNTTAVQRRDGGCHDVNNNGIDFNVATPAPRNSATPANPCTTGPVCGTADFNGDGDVGTDQDIEAFFRCLAGNCCALCFEGGADFNGDGDVGTDQDIEAFFRVLAGNPC